MPRSGISQATNNGLTKLESCGKAEIVIGWRRSKRHMGNTGLIPWEETPEALAKLIEETSELPTEYLWEFGARAREYVLINKNWDVQARRVIDFLREIIARRGGARVEDPSR